MEYLESSTNCESTIDLYQYLIILKRRQLPALVVFILTFAATTLISMSKKPIYVAEGKMLIKKLSTISSLTQVGKGIGQLQSVDDSKSSPLDTEKEILLSRPLIDKTITTLDLKDEEKKEPLTKEQFLEKISLTRISRTDIIQVSYRDTDPDQAAAVVNTLMNFYLKHNISNNRTEAKSARKFLEEQLPEAQAKVERAEMALYNFSKKNNLIIPIKEQKNSGAEIIADLDQKIVQIRSEYADVNNHIKLLRNNLSANPQETVSITSLNQSFLNTSSSQFSEEEALLERLEQLESELAIQRSRFTPINPMLAPLEAEVEAVKKQVLGKLEAKRKNLANQIATLSQEKSVYKQKLMNLLSWEQRQRQLETQLQTAQFTYSKLRDNLEAVKLAENQTVANVQVISPALVPEKPVSARKSLTIVTGLLLGSLASIGSIWFLEQTDKSLKTVDEAKMLLGLPVLGVIPQIKESARASLSTSNLKDFNRAMVFKNDSIVPLSQSYFPLSQSYRMLRTNLRFLQSHNEIKSLVVTSSIPQEGKSTVTFNLSQSMAERAQKVLLVDADLRLGEQNSSSNLSHRLGLSINQLGLSDVLAGKINYQTAIKQVMKNIDIMPAGIGFLNPIAYLDSPAMASLLEKFSTDYDFVIIDTPHLIANSEALVLGKMSDGIVLVVRPGLVDAVGINIAKELLQQSGQNVLGIVVNGVIPDNEPHQYYY